MTPSDPHSSSPPNAPPNELPSQISGQVCSVMMPSAFTVLEAVSLEQTVRKLFGLIHGLKKLVLNCQVTTFVDSSGLGALVICLRHCRQQECELVLRNVQPQLQMVLEMADLEQYFTLEEPIDQATSTVGGALQKKQLVPSSPPTAMPHPSVQSLGKRGIDIVGALVGLFLTALLFIPIALAITWEDRGPIFFGQTRCSWMGRQFKMWKFRSMVVNAEALKHQVENQVQGPLFKNENDPRITRVGRFLRRTSLDELPQFWNVLEGDMSLVGTRPPTPDELQQYHVPAWQRLDVKPGMTGEWQVNGRSTVKRFEDVIQMDLAYQQHWSLGYDLKLIVKTVLILFSKQAGAA